MLILLCDAFDASMPRKLERFGEVTSDMARLGEAEVVLVRSKTKCTREFIDKAPKLKLIIREGVGIDNIDKAYAESKGIIVHNTPSPQRSPSPN
jgi:D-3-phosphoglycerate dehydrogenase